MPYFDPKFPIVKPEPTIDDCIKSFRGRDYFYVGGVTGMSWIYGFILGKPSRFPTASFTATMGFSYGILSIICSSRDRLMGFEENAKEVEKWGKAKIQVPDQPPQDMRYPTAKYHKSVLKPKVDWDAWK